MPPRLSQRDLEAILDKGLLQTHSEQKQRITELERSNAILHTVEDRLSALEDEMEVVKSELAEKTLLVDTLQKKLGEEREKRRGMGKGVTQWKERCEAYEKRWLRLRLLVDEDPEFVVNVAPSETPVALPFTIPETLLPSSLPRRALAMRKPTPHVSDVSSPTVGGYKRTRPEITPVKTPPPKRLHRPVTPVRSTNRRQRQEPIQVKEESPDPVAYDESDEEDPLAMM